MDEQKNNQQEGQKGKTTCACGSGCSCGCGYGYNSKNRVIWWVVAVFILLVVFAMGIKAGEFRDELHSAFGGYYHGYPMMQHGE